jgi:hypothetical protein
MAINFLNFRASLEEKTLTPAELKKREEVAKAIKREHPNMPMGMKMAIATKTAKRVAEAKDPREYDYEGDMAKSQLRSIIANSKQVHDMLKDDTNISEWVQSKITLAADYMSTVADYMQSEVNEAAQLDEMAATDRFKDYHNETAKLIKGIHTALSDHYKMHEKNAHWGHVGDIRHYHDQLRDIHDRLHEQGEYAKDSNKRLAQMQVKEEADQLDEVTAEKAMKQHHAWVKGMEGQTSDTISKKLEQAKQKETAHHNEVKKKLDSGEMKHGSQEHKAMVNTWNRLSRNTKDLETKHSWLKEKEAKAKNVSEENNIVAVIDGVRSSRKYNDADHAHNSLSKLVSYQKAKKAELYVNGEKTKHYELNKKYSDFEPKKLSEEIIKVKDPKAHLKTLLNRHSELAIAANKDGDHEAVKYHQAKMNAAKSQMAKLAKEDVDEEVKDEYSRKVLKYLRKKYKKEDQHYCAKHVYSELFGEGQVIEADHAEPDENGNIEWYNVQFEHGAEKVFTEDIEIMVAEYHANHKRKKRKMMEDDNGQ